MTPIGDDDSGRTVTPFVNYLLIVANIAVFVLLQGMGASDRFTYAFSTVPQEIVSGNDVVTPGQGSRERPVLRAAGAATHSDDGLPDPPDLPVHARRHRPHRRQHALSLDLRR
jgi:hypothetical protein